MRVHPPRLLFPVSRVMREFEEPVEQAYLTRTEVEMELARLALLVMRAAPETFEDLGARGRAPRPEAELPAEVASRLLSRTRPEHRVFVESRLLELARCLAGVRTDGMHEWLDLTINLPGPPRRQERIAPRYAPERRSRR